ncbi:MAG: MMPL family transporter [Myxococcota bacterium]
MGLLRPRVTIALSLLVLLGCGLYAADMPVSTSRYELVSAENPFQARSLRFFDRFGYPDALVVVVTGGDDAARRDAVDGLGRAYEEVPELKGRVLGRVQARQVAELMLLAKPETLREMRTRFHGEPADIIEGGIPRLVSAISEQLEAGLEGDADAVPNPGAVPPSGIEGGAPREGKAPPPPPGPDGGGGRPEHQLREGMAHLAQMLRALDTQLAGGDALALLPGVETADVGPDGTVDDEGYLVGGDGRYHMLALFPDLPSAEGDAVKPLVDRIRAIRDATPRADGVEVRVTGLPALSADELVLVKRGIVQTSGATTVAILLLLLAAFRSFRYTILSLLPLGVGVVLTLAATKGIVGGLNLVTSTFIPVLLALGIDFGVYVLNRYGELTRAGATVEIAIQGALAKAGPGMLMGAVTTMMAFMMTTTIEFTAYSELGTITAAGLALMLVVTFLLLPALIFAAGRGKNIEAPELRGITHLPGLIRRGRHAIPILAAAVAIGFATQIPRLDFNARYFDFIPAETESASALREIERDRSMSPVLASTPTDGVEQARAVAAKLRDLPSVASVQTASDLLPPLDAEGLRALRAGFDGLRDPDFDKLRERVRSTSEIAAEVTDLIDLLDEVAFGLRQAGDQTSLAALTEAREAAVALNRRLDGLEDDAPTLAAAEREMAALLERSWRTGRAVAARGHYVPSDLPEVFEARFMSRDGEGLAVYATPTGDVWNAETAAAFAAEVTAVAPETSGLAVSIHEHMRMIRDGFRWSSLLSAGFVIVILLVGFRRVGDALLAGVPVVIGACFMLGTMALIGMDIDVANIVALPLILGVGIDAGAHMVHRWRQSADERGGVADLDEVIRGTGSAVLMASLTTASGFAALILGDYGAMKTLGTSMSLGIFGCLLASLFVLPALLVAVKKAR